MTKNRYWAIALILGTATCYFLYPREASQVLTQTNNPTQAPMKKNVGSVHINTTPTNSDATKVQGRFPSSAGYSMNVPSTQWQQRLEETFKEQAGESLKKVVIKRERSFIWNKDNTPLHVEMVVVKLTSNQDVESSFRAVVDSQTGKILETFDRTIFDPAEVRAEAQIKLDPRYFN